MKATIGAALIVVISAILAYIFYSSVHSDNTKKIEYSICDNLNKSKYCPLILSEDATDDSGLRFLLFRHGNEIRRFYSLVNDYKIECESRSDIWKKRQLIALYNKARSLRKVPLLEPRSKDMSEIREHPENNYYSRNLSNVTLDKVPELRSMPPNDLINKDDPYGIAATKCYGYINYRFPPSDFSE